MTRQHPPQQQFKEARQLAKDHGMFVVDKGDRFLLYRKMPHRNIYLGMRTGVEAFRRFVAACAGGPPANRRAA